MHDEAAALEEIKGLSLNARHHLSHVLRNGLCSLLGSRCVDLERVVMEIEAKIKDMGL